MSINMAPSSSCRSPGGATARRLFDSAPIEARDILKPARRHGGGRAWVSLLSIEKPGQ